MGTAKSSANVQKGIIFQLGEALGIVVRGSKDDGLHGLVSAMTGKLSVAALTDEELIRVSAELRRRAKNAGISVKRKKKREDSPSGMTAGQQGKVWRLMYRLRDASPSSVLLGERLCGAIHKELGIDASPKDPFRWLNYQQGSQLIEALKEYVAHTGRPMNGGGLDDRGAGTAGASPAGGSQG